MPWAARRRLVISIIVGAVVIAFLSFIGIATFYKTPTCTDNVQNQGEYGVDCGGPCPYLCTDQVIPPTILFTTAVRAPGGRIDIAALIQNKNPDAAAKDVPYRIQLFATDRLPIADISGTIDLPPGANVPVYIPGASDGKQPVANAFLTIDPNAVQWYSLPHDPRNLPAVSNITSDGIDASPRIDATLSNPSVSMIANTRVIVFVHDALKNVIAASQTIVPSIPPQGSATATFTWNAPFASSSAEIDVMPIVPLP